MVSQPCYPLLVIDSQDEMKMIFCLVDVLTNLGASKLSQSGPQWEHHDRADMMN